MSNMKTHIYALIEEIAAAEKITRVKLAELSRDMLIYVMDSQDIDAVNRLIGVLTTWHKKGAVPYFSHFLPWEVEKDDKKNFVRFGKKYKSTQKVVKKQALITDWLSKPENHIWTWVDDNLEVKQLDFNARIKSAIKKALEGDEKTDTPPMSQEQVLQAIFESDLSVEDILSSVAKLQMAQEEANAVMEQAERGTP